jgi:hypothetical protein
MNVEDAVHLLVDTMRRHGPGQTQSYGYELYIPEIIRAYIRAANPKAQGLDIDTEIYKRKNELAPAFLAAAWELCRRGIIRPGVYGLGYQSTDEGSAGFGYTVTPFGRQWLAESNRDDYVPVEPGRFGQMLAPFSPRFGAAFQERAQEAIRCYGAHAYLACCAMCGAAAESILLATAVAQQGESAVEAYLSSKGRSRLEASLLGQVSDQTRREFLGFTALIKYWRDAAAHGAPANLSDNEAYTSLAMLLRFAQFATDHWDELVKRGV